MRSLFALLIWLLPSLAGAAQALHLDPNEQVQVTLLDRSATPTSWNIAPSTPERRRLATWLANNDSGWQPYLVTTPGAGILVSTQGWRLQFVKDMVLLCRNQEPCNYKTIEIAEYQFLLASRPNQ